MDTSILAQRYKSLVKHTCLISSTLNPHEIKKRSILAAIRLLGAETGSLLMVDKESNELYFEVALGEKGETLKTLRLAPGQGIAGWVAEHREPLLIDDVQQDPRFFKKADHTSGFTTRNLICVPVKTGDRILGALQVVNKLSGAFDESDLEILQAFSNHVAISILNASLFDELNETFMSTVEGLADIIEKRDPYTGGHTKRVRDYALVIGREIGFDKENMKLLHLASVLHDIGKIGVPDSVLLKSGKLDVQEHTVMAGHSSMGAEMLSRISHLRCLAPFIRHHHENYDATGYPAKLKGEDIPLISRIIAVADAFDAMTSDRPYRAGMRQAEAFDELLRCSGTQFDSGVVKAFHSAWSEGRLQQQPPAPPPG